MDDKTGTQYPPETVPAASAMQMLQNGMRGEAEKAGIRTEQDVVDLVKSEARNDKASK